MAALRDHLRVCGACHQVWLQYQTLASEGFPMLAADYEHPEAKRSWNDSAARRRLFARIDKPGLPFPANRPRNARE